MFDKVPFWVHAAHWVCSAPNEAKMAERLFEVHKALTKEEQEMLRRFFVKLSGGR